MKAFEFQIVRVVNKGACGRLIPVGKPVIVENECQDAAQCIAASRKLEEKHNTDSSYHKFLVAQAQGRKTNVSEWMPYEWFVVRGELAT